MRRHTNNPSAKFSTLQAACEELNSSRDTVLKLAREAGALYKIGRLNKIDMPRLYDYMDRVCKVEDA